MTAAAAPGARTSTGYRYVVVWFLAIVYTFNFMDRQIMSILAEPIRKDLGLSDTQLGMLTGLAFAAFYTTFGIPVAWLADRARRVWIMAAACGIWSVFTAACGLATNFTQLALARVFVGVGEAGGSPPSYSLISDYFPPKERGTGLAIYSLGVPAGSMVGSALGGWVAANHGWRMAFFVVGLPGVLLALLLLVVVREPKRGGLDALAAGHAAHPPSPPIGAAIASFFANRTLVLTAISSGLSAFVGYAMLSWNPAFLIRVKEMSLKDVAVYYSLVMGITGMIGTFGAGFIVDRLGQIDRRWYAWVPAIAFTLSVPFFAGFLLAPNWRVALAFLAVPALMNNMYLAPAITVIQNAVAPAQRTVSSAILLFILNLVGLGGGPVFVGMISDHAKPQYGEHSLLIGLAALFPMIALTVGAHLAASLSIGRDKRLADAL
ncbi:MFS transporter [Phenylobacterium hankyongense]|uniref:MFS transporter n=1 Tax=Phenylobacterium hankyongense TaxID=1813876 RepID=A0A328B2A5_9CAUL|nr:MFS transporter [Phenylobacterium hankyongense]RAK60655.1 MFS transporter [Phenylobacterium hankyongense]